MHNLFLRSAHGLLDDLATTLFPATCRLCHGPLTRAFDSAVCTACLSGILPPVNPQCTRCGEALAPEAIRALALTRYAELANLCPLCRMAQPDFDRAVAYATYEDELREAIHLLKYNRARTLARPLGAMLAAAALTLEAASDDLLVIPVPLFAPKKNERGYDQSTLLATSMLRHLRTRRPAWQLATNILERTRNTRSQFGLMSHQRRANLRGAFVIRNAAALSGREVLLIDDIMTTGATARECARVLRKAGAVKVWVATVARAQRHDLTAAWDAPMPHYTQRQQSLILN